MYHISCIRNNYRKLLHVLISKQHRNIFVSSCTLDLTSFKSNENKNLNYRNNYCLLKVPAEINFLSFTKRNYSKKRKSSNKKMESDEESDSEEEDYIESLETDEIEDNVITKAIPSMRIDTIIKAALGISKKKVEKEFYAFNLRLNGEKVLKKAMIVSVGDEIDLVKDVSPDNDNFLIVDRIIIMSVGNITGNLNYPLKLQVLKNLTIENYSEPWRKSGKDEVEP